MPDIALRLNKDMLVVSAPVEQALARQGVDVDQDMEYMLINEPEAIRDALNLENAVGAQCLVTPTASITQARLAHHYMENDGQTLVNAAKSIANGLKPQHVLVEIGPCGLPLDPSSEASLKEHRGQYAGALELLGTEGYDAVFFNGFTRVEDLACALDAANEIGFAAPVFASVALTDEGGLAHGATLEEAAACAAERGAAAFGFETAQGADDAAALVRRVKAACDLPVMVQFHVNKLEPKAYEPADDNPYCRADIMVTASAKVYAAGAQFVRATGAATASYTGALMATVTGLDVKL